MPSHRLRLLASCGALLLLIAGRPVAAGAAGPEPAIIDAPSQAGMAGQVSADGRTYTNAALGIAIRVPAALQGWTLGRDPASPQILLMIASPDGRVNIGLGYQAL